MRRWPLTVAALVAVALSVAGCGHPLVPDSALRPPATPGAPTPAASSTPTSTVPELGIDLYAKSSYPLPVVVHDGRRNLAYIASTIGAQDAGIVWNLYSPSATSDTVTHNAATLSPAAVAALTRIAQAHHLSVQYRPLIRVGPQWHWEGSIRPPDKRAWFESLFQAELPYLRIAQQLHVSEFVVGTEFFELHASAQWPWFLARVRSVYHGTVSYAAQMRQYFHMPRDLPPLSEYGVDAYPYLNLPPTASTAQLVAGWDHFFGNVPESLLQRTAMDEVGIPAIAGAYAHPPLWAIRGEPDQQVQVRWFTAACTVARQYSMRAIYFYEVNLTEDPAQPMSFPASFAGKPGAKAIQGCLHILGRAPAAHPERSLTGPHGR